MNSGSWWVILWEVISSTIHGAWTGFAWPHAVLFVSLVIIAKFKVEISAAISRLNKVGPVEFMPPPMPVDVSAKAAMGAGVDEATQVPVSSGLKGIPLPPISFTHTMSVASSNLEHEIGGLTAEEQVPYLKERLAFSRVLIDFETIYFAIYGGQLELLSYLNQRAFNLASRTEIEGLWNAHKAKFNGHLDNWSLDGYLYFLTFNNLVSSGPMGYSITMKGKEFLVWMTQMSRPLMKPW